MLNVILLAMALLASGCNSKNDTPAFFSGNGSPVSQSIDANDGDVYLDQSNLQLWKRNGGWNPLATLTGVSNTSSLDNTYGNAVTASTSEIATLQTALSSANSTISNLQTGLNTVTTQVSSILGGLGISSGNITSTYEQVTAASSSNTYSTMVKRDGSGNFSASTITSNLVGNVTGNLTGDVTGNVSGTAGSAITLTSLLGPSMGGTGYANGGILRYGSSNLTFTTSGATTLTLPTSGMVAVTPAAGFVKSTGTALTATNAINMTSDVTGILPVANGGTGTSLSTGTGSLVFNNSPTLTGIVTASTIVGTLSGAATMNVLKTGDTISGVLATTGQINYAYRNNPTNTTSIDWSNGQVQQITLTDCTSPIVSFSNMNSGGTYTLVVTVTGGSSGTISFNGSSSAGSIADSSFKALPDKACVANKTQVYTFVVAGSTVYMTNTGAF